MKKYRNNKKILLTDDTPGEYKINRSTNSNQMVLTANELCDLAPETFVIGRATKDGNDCHTFYESDKLVMYCGIREDREPFEGIAFGVHQNEADDGTATYTIGTIMM